MKKLVFLLVLVLGSFGMAQDASTALSAMQVDNVEDLMEEINANLEAMGANVRFDKLEYIVDPEAGFEAQGRTLFASDRTLRLDSQWVPNDPRRGADGTNLNFLIDPRFTLANGTIDSAPSIRSSFQTWDSGTNCSDVPIYERPFRGVEPNYVLGLIFGFPANPFEADIVTTGFLPGFVFDIIAPSGSQFILGVCWSLTFVDDNGESTDINNDGFADRALSEVWYNDSFLWTTNGGGADIENVALHENGHALGLGHFGNIAVVNGRLKVSPRAIMNASYLGPDRELKGTDRGAHCSLYADWKSQ